MLKRNYKKLVSLISALAMTASFATPFAMAEDTEIVSADEMAALAAGSVIIEEDFNALEEKVFITLDKAKQDPYTELEIADIYIGNSNRGGAEDTGAWIKDGVGVDGSKALVLSAGAKATGTYGPRLDFKVPSTEDNYLISMEVYPTSKQDMAYTDSTEKAPTAANEFGLTADEWNKVDIYVTRKGRIFNVNDTVTVFADDAVTAPVIWGSRTDNAGEMYIDNIVVTAAMALPTAIPTPSPEPPYQPKVGDVFNFNDVATGTLVFLNNVATPTYTALDGFELNVSSRNGGAAANTLVEIASGVGVDGSNAMRLNYDTFADTSRGPRITLVEPLEDEYVITFKAKSDGNQDIVVAADSSSNSGSELDIKSDDWSTVEIYVFDGQRLIVCDGRYVSLTATTDLPTLWGLNKNGSGSFYLDDYEIKEVTEQGVTDAMATTLDITNAEETVYLNNDGTYNFIEGFAVPESTCGNAALWEVFESTDDGATWVATEDLTAGKTSISTKASISEEKLYKAVGTVYNGDLEASKEFILKYVKPENVIDVVLADLDITSELYAAQVEKKEVETEEGTATSYIIRGDFAVTESEWVTTIEWESSDESLVKVGAKGSILVFPKENTTVTLTATVSYGGESKTKEFTLDLANYYTSIYRLVDTELANVTLAPKGTNGSKVTTVTLDPENETKVTFDLDLSTSSSTKGMEIEWKTSDKDILSSDGVINVDNMDSNEVTLTKEVTYSINGTEVYSAEKDYAINVEFDPEAVKDAAVELATAYALANDAKADADEIEDSTYYSAAMEMLYDRYVTRFDANYAENFEDIDDKVSSDFDLPTEGAFGSTITWTSSLTNIKINKNGEADVTRPANDKKGKLTATFTSGASVNENGYEHAITVDGKGGSSSGGGGSKGSGGGNSYVGSLGALTATPAPTVTTPDTTVKGEFTDLDQASWAAVAINYLADKGIVAGRTSTTFDPNATVTRAEFAKMVAGAFEIPMVAASAGFADVPADAWYAPYVSTCFAAKIITGYDSTTFGPNDLISRQDMAVMVMRAANLKGITVEAIAAKVDFADADKIGAYAVDAVTTLQMGGIINGMTADTFAPAENATRAQAAKILYSFCN